MSNYDQKAIEQKWQDIWRRSEIYHFDFEDESRPIFSIDVPPRYASGPLHAGHAVHYTHIDFAARFKRMMGYNVFFPLCFDVNGIPIEERVERKLGITRKDIDRHEFTKLCSEFANKNIATMIEQFQILGESMDPTIYYQTDAEYYRRITQITFIELFKKGLIYKGKFPVNWCPRCMTAMADAEVTYKDNETKLNTIKFYFVSEQPEGILNYSGIGKDDKGAYIEIATTRPEMLPSCQIVAVHPNDEKAPWLVDQVVRVPLFGKEVKIVEDDAVDPEFGTGMVMICTVGDKEDLNWVFKYKLPLEMSISEEGTMTELCGKYAGLKIVDARAEVIKELEQQGLLIGQIPLKQNVGVCWRCKTAVEFINAEQWFLKTVDFKKLVLEKSDEMNWFPEYMKVRLVEWVNSLEWDWVISRQRYFATPIPLWECKSCGEVVLARSEDTYVDPTVDRPPVSSCPKCGCEEFVGCEDVFDTWMDSSISPLFNTFWHRDEKRFSRLYPMSVRPQSHDIIRTWAFYTILRCTLITDQKPFENIMMGGFILSEDGTPMHASLGNVIDPLGIIDEFGTDAFRCYAASCALGEDNPYRSKDVIRGTKVLRKLYNVQSFIANLLENEKPQKPESLCEIDRWILSKFSRLVKQSKAQMEVFDYSQCMKDIEFFLWHEVADHYLEMIKSSVYEGKNKESITYTLYTLGLGMLKLFAVFFPHVTEELYDRHYKAFEGEQSIHVSLWPEEIVDDEQAIVAGENVKSFIAQVRAWKSEQKMALNAQLDASASYAKQKTVECLENNRDIVISTLKLPIDHEFRVGKPDVIEKISSVAPVFSKLGPTFKAQAKTLVDFVKSNQDQVIGIIEQKGDIFVEDIDGLECESVGGLVESGFLSLEKSAVVQGSSNAGVVCFDGFYLQVNG